MPRGDGQKSGQPRTRYRRSTPQYIPAGLARRQRWWDNLGTKDDPGNNRVSSQSSDGKEKYTTYDGVISFRRPGSQKR